MFSRFVSFVAPAFGFVLAGVTLPGAVPNPVEINPSEVMRGGAFTIKVTGAPAASSASVRLVRNASATEGGISAFDGKAAGGPIITVTLPDGDAIDLGNYEVQVLLDSKSTYRGNIRVRPAGSGDIQLAEFDPPNTYDLEPVWRRAPSSADEVATRNLRYFTATAPDLGGHKPVVLLNGSSVEVDWTGCDRLARGTSQEPIPQSDRIYGSLGLGGRVELCRVPPGKLAFANSSVLPAEDPGKAETVVERVLKGSAAVPTVRLDLKGAGFVRHPPEDNTIWINGVRQSIVWDSCSPGPPAGTASAPVNGGIHGEVVGSEQIVLCHVPVPENGRLLVAAGYGDSPGDKREFSVYRTGKWRAAVYSLAITAVLALLVAICIWGIKRTYEIVDRDGKRQQYRLRVLLLDPETNTYSLSKFQFYVWTAAALFAYAYLYISKVIVQHLAWPDIPGSLPAIVGIGAGTAVGSQIVTGSMGSKGAGTQLPSAADFLTSGGVAAPDRVQMFLWTLFGVGAFCVGVLQNGPGTIKEIAPVPDGMLYMMGLSAAGYLGGKLARKPGPVINEISISPPDSDDGLAKSALAAGTDLPDLAAAAVPASAVLAALTTPKNANAKTSADALKAAIQATTSAHTTSEVTELMGKLAGFRTEAERGAEQAAADFAKNPEAKQDAQTAQIAAASLQELSAAVTSAISMAAVPSMEASIGSRSVTRTIELRGSNLAADAMFEIGHAELPFRMMTTPDGQSAPEVVARQDGGTFARVLRLTIDPAKLASSDLAQYQRWFGPNSRLPLTITNPDGQKAELSFSVPPAAAQKTGD